MKDEKISLPKELFDDTPLEPTKVFDNLYCIGSRSVVAWVLETSEGIILIDSMWDNHDGKLIIDGMKELKLSPSDIKYIIITHGHGDHYGGAQFIKDNCNAKIAMTETDYNFMNTVNIGANGPRSTKCKVDIMISDNQEIELGDTRVKVVETPGHTPGCISLIFPVKENGVIYNAMIWGGTGAPSKLEEKLKYRESIDHFRTYAKREKVSVEITAHLFCENGYSKLEEVRNRKEHDKNPFIIGEDGINKYLDDLRENIEDMIEKQMNEK